MLFRTKTKDQQAGFTVIEFIVIMSIFAAMASVALFNFRDFSDVTELNNLAFDVALELKRAQTIGSSSIDDTTGVRSAVTVTFPPVGGGALSDVFEVYRELDLTQAGQLGALELGAGDILDRRSQLNGGSIGSIEICDNSSCDDLSSHGVSVSFMRPRTEPIVLSGGCNQPLGLENVINGASGRCRGDLQITITEDGRSRIIHIEPTGNIYVK
jgi:type II secretory pathway pseudopilin PulG